MFIRIKKRNNANYAYLVQNKWYKTHQQSRQKVKKYLGRVYTPKKSSELDLIAYLNLQSLQNLDDYIKKSKPENLLLDLVCLELSNHSFKCTKTSAKTSFWQLENIIVDLKKRKVFDQTTLKPVCLELNNNFLNNLTLTKLLGFEPPKQSTKLQIGKALANTILESGIKIDQTLFVKLFEKMYCNLK